MRLTRVAGPKTTCLSYGPGEGFALKAKTLSPKGERVRVRGYSSESHSKTEPMGGRKERVGEERVVHVESPHAYT